MQVDLEVDEVGVEVEVAAEEEEEESLEEDPITQGLVS